MRSLKNGSNNVTNCYTDKEKDIETDKKRKPAFSIKHEII